MTANEVQHGGTHYKQFAIQPWDFILSNNLGYLEGSAIKYISRWKFKGGVEDIKKAIHFLQKLVEHLEYDGFNFQKSIDGYSGPDEPKNTSVDYCTTIYDKELEV